MKGILAGWLILGWALGVPAATARAQAEDRVVLLEDPAQPPRPGLLQALRIQLLGIAEVDVRQAPEIAGVSGQIEAATGVAAEPETLLVVWAEPTVELPDGSSEAVLYVVGHEQGRALLEIVRVPGGGGPDVDRSLAIKVGEVVHEVRTNRARAAPEVMLEPAPPAPAPAPSPGAEPPAGPTWGLVAALGAAASPLSGSELGQWGVRGGLGAAYLVGGLRLSGLAELSWFPQLQVASEPFEARLHELGPDLLARAQLRERPLWVGLRAGGGIASIEAEGQSARRSGERGELVATWLVGFDVELEIAGGFGLVAALELQGREPRRRFTVEGERVADLGRLRPLALLALTFSDARVR